MRWSSVIRTRITGVAFLAERVKTGYIAPARAPTLARDNYIFDIIINIFINIDLISIRVESLDFSH